jgi:hypothetical protein
MAILVQAPPRTPREGGIKSVASPFITVPRLGLPEGDLVWEDSTCGFTDETWVDCVRPLDAELKTGAGVTQYEVQVPAFARYKGVSCFIGGDGVGPSFQEQAESALAAGEDRPIEAALWAWAALAPTPGAAATIAEAIAAAEDYADTNYVGRPILLISREDAELAYTAGALDFVNGNLVTGNKTPVLASGEIPSGSIAVVGGIAVYVTDVVAKAAAEYEDNIILAVAERKYAIGIDCAFRYVVTVTP